MQSRVALCSHVSGNGLPTIDVNVHHHKLAARKIMAALYCRRVRTHTHNYSLDIVLLIKFDFFFPPRSLGGMCGAVVTSPFDVVKTRLQSDLFRQKHAGVGAVIGDSVVLVRRPGGILWHFVETAHIIRLRPRLFPCSSIRDKSHYTHLYGLRVRQNKNNNNHLGTLQETSLPARYLRVSCPLWWGSFPRAR